MAEWGWSAGQQSHNWTLAQIIGEALPSPAVSFSRKSESSRDRARNTNPSQVFSWSAAQTVKKDLARYAEVKSPYHHQSGFEDSAIATIIVMLSASD